MSLFSKPYICSIICLIGLSSRLVADDRLEPVVKDTNRLAKVSKIALLPIVTQVRFDKFKDIPDPNRVSARISVAKELPSILENQLKETKFKLLPPEAATLALKELDIQPVDLFITTKNGSLSAPSETFKNKKGDEAILLAPKDSFKQKPQEMTVYRYKWHDLPDTNIGLASFDLAVLAKPNIETLKTVSSKLGADAILLCQVTEMETHEGTTGVSVFAQRFKSTRIHLHFTLISTDDYSVIWQAKAKGIKSQRAGYFMGNRSYNGEDRKAVEGAVQATEFLLSDLTGSPIKPEK